MHDPAVYPDPDEFIPERWMPGGANADDSESSKNWLVFGESPSFIPRRPELIFVLFSGAGAHRCIAQSYVFMHMNAVIGSAAMLLDWTHEKTPESDEIQYVVYVHPESISQAHPSPAGSSRPCSPKTAASSSSRRVCRREPLDYFTS